MAKGKLDPLTIKTLGPGNHGDGQGLYLRIVASIARPKSADDKPEDSRTWAFRYTRVGKAHWISLGRFSNWTLAEARVRAKACRRQLDDGIDPLAAKRKRKVESVGAKTFAEVADDYIAAHSSGWKNKKHGRQWKNTLDQHATKLMVLPVATIGVEQVHDVLGAIWTKLPETAGRLRGRIEAILDYAAVKQLRKGDNPARWKGHLDNLLPARSKVAKVVHHPALPWADAPEMFGQLAKSEGMSAKCLAFLALTAARSSEARGARWSEINLEKKIWIVPAERMKGAREHRVPLSNAVVAGLEELQPGKKAGNELVFPGGRVGRPLSDVALNKALHSAGGNGTTVHGLRSTFRDWASEAIAVPREVAELALAHVNRDKTESAYARSDLFERRKQLMQQWANHCMGRLV